VAEFKKFQAAPKVATGVIDPAIRLAFEKSLQRIVLDKEIPSKDIIPLLKNPDDNAALLRDKARELEKQAEQMRKLALAVHHERCVAELAELFKAPEEKVDLARAALLVARFDNEELDVEFYRQELDRLARIVAERLPKGAKPQAALDELNKFLFKERGFHGSHTEYYSRSNSYLNEVIDDREGLPITLSVLYIELARRLKLNVVGVPLPGHFMVRHEPKGEKPQLIDVFDGKPITRAEAEAKVKKVTGEPPAEKHFESVTKKAIVVRILHNLLNVARAEKDGDAMLRYLDGILAIDPDAHEDRWARANFRYFAGRPAAALEDCEHLLKHAPASAVDHDDVRELRRRLEKK
jgi:regulator of sirC expression with transglutaminase-like and TPR domain